MTDLRTDKFFYNTWRMLILHTDLLDDVRRSLWVTSRVRKNGTTRQRYIGTEVQRYRGTGRYRGRYKNRER